MKEICNPKETMLIAKKTDNKITGTIIKIGFGVVPPIVAVYWDCNPGTPTTGGITLEWLMDLVEIEEKPKPLLNTQVANRLFLIDDGSNDPLPIVKELLQDIYTKLERLENK